MGKPELTLYKQVLEHAYGDKEKEEGGSAPSSRKV